MATNFKNLSQKLKRNQGIVLITLLVVMIGGIVAYRQYSIWADKQRFEQAQASIDALYSDIVANVGQPDKVEKGQTCGYASRKYERGPLSCGDYLYFVYGVANNNQANERFQGIKQAILQNQSTFNVTFSNETSVVPFNTLRDNRDREEIGMDITETKSNIACTLRALYASKDSNGHVLTTDVQTENMSVAIGCSDDAKVEHYPIVEN